MIKLVTDQAGNRHEIQIDDELAWLSPYLSAAKKLGVLVWRVAAIKGYSVPPDKLERQDAAIAKDGNKKVTITILKWHQIWARKKGKLQVSHYEAADYGSLFENTLDSLAHELSHLTHWEHTADRLVLEKKLLYSFACLARRRGYKGYGP